MPPEEETFAERIAHRAGVTLAVFVTVVLALAAVYGVGFYVALICRIFYLGWRQAWGLL